MHYSIVEKGRSVCCVLICVNFLVSTETLQTYLSKKYLNISGIMALKSESESIEFDVYAAMEKLKGM